MDWVWIYWIHFLWLLDLGSLGLGWVGFVEERPPWALPSGPSRPQRCRLQRGQSSSRRHRRWSHQRSKQLPNHTKVGGCLILSDYFSIITFVLNLKQVKLGFINYQPQPKYSTALSKMGWKGKNNRNFGMNNFRNLCWIKIIPHECQK